MSAVSNCVTFLFAILLFTPESGTRIFSLVVFFFFILLNSCRNTLTSTIEWSAIQGVIGRVISNNLHSLMKV